MAMALLGNAAVNASLVRPELASLVANRPQSSGAGDSAGRGRLPRSARVGGGLQFGGRRGGRDDERRRVAMAAVLDPHSFAFLDLHSITALDLHSFAFLADVIDESKLPVRITLEASRVITDHRNTWRVGEQDIKNIVMAASLVFTWGCCVFGAMNDPFYDSDEYRQAGGNGTGHWIYDRQEREERAAREEMWSEDLLKEIEEKAEEVRKNEEKEKEKEKEVELV